MARHDIHELMRSMNYNERLTALVCSVISTRRDAIASAEYMIESASVMSIALSGREKTRLALKMRDTADELERQVMVG
jgi:hypothetical protein